uniref:Uncharacterized protein n=1 Tax=Nymphaea colorata TaxID=210225 RepID=A0A5K0XZQ8_9MAGN
MYVDNIQGGIQSEVVSLGHNSQGQVEEAVPGSRGKRALTVVALGSSTGDTNTLLPSKNWVLRP